MQTYLLYAEWADPKGWMNIEVSGIVPRFLNHVEKCGWNGFLAEIRAAALRGGILHLRGQKIWYGDLAPGRSGDLTHC